MSSLPKEMGAQVGISGDNYSKENIAHDMYMQVN